VQRQLGHATASITLDSYGHLFPDELDALAGLARAQRGPAVVPIREALVSERIRRCRRRGSNPHTMGV